MACICIALEKNDFPFFAQDKKCFFSPIKNSFWSSDFGWWASFSEYVYFGGGSCLLLPFFFEKEKNSCLCLGDFSEAKKASFCWPVYEYSLFRAGGNGQDQMVIWNIFGWENIFFCIEQKRGNVQNFYAQPKRYGNRCFLLWRECFFCVPGFAPA